MHEYQLSNRNRLGASSERGIAAIILLFAMSAFSVLSIAALTTPLGSAPAGRTFSIFRTVPQDALIKFIAPLVVPNEWRAQGQTGSFEFQLPVLVPETGKDENGASAAWHGLTEVSGVAVCCEARSGVCAQRTGGTGEAPIVDWSPGAHDALWLSFTLASHPSGANAAEGQMVTATVATAADSPPSDVTAVSCQLEFDGAVIAEGTTQLRQIVADGAEVVTGSMRFAVRTQ